MEIASVDKMSPTTGGKKTSPCFACKVADESIIKVLRFTQEQLNQAGEQLRSRSRPYTTSWVFAFQHHELTQRRWQAVDSAMKRARALCNCGESLSPSTHMAGTEEPAEPAREGTCVACLVAKEPIEAVLQLLHIQRTEALEEAGFKRRLGSNFWKNDFNLAQKYKAQISDLDSAKEAAPLYCRCGTNCPIWRRLQWEKAEKEMKDLPQPGPALFPVLFNILDQATVIKCIIALGCFRLAWHMLVDSSGQELAAFLTALVFFWKILPTGS